MKFDEIIPAYNMGDMVPFTVTSEAAEVRHCSCCNARLSRYNPEGRCSPCKNKERDIITESLSEIFNNDGVVIDIHPDEW